MTDFLVFTLSGLALGSSFALIGSGFVLVHRVTNVVNFTQGTLAVIGGLLSATLATAGLPPGLREVVAIVGAGAAGLLFGFIAIGRRGTSPLVSLLITLGLSIVAAGLIILIWGQDPVSPPGVPGTVTLLGARIEIQRLLIAGAAALALAAMELFLSRTDLGRGLTAAASNPRAAQLVGISPRRMGLVAFAVAGVLGGLAGVLIAPTTALSFSSDLPLALSGFAAAVFGGLQSPWRTYVGGLVLGVSGQLVAGYLNGSLQTQIALVMMLIVMIVRHRSFAVEEAK